MKTSTFSGLPKVRERHQVRVLAVCVGAACCLVGGCSKENSSSVPDLSDAQQVERQIQAVRRETKLTPQQKSEQIAKIQAAATQQSKE